MSQHTSREAWLTAAVDLLRHHFGRYEPEINVPALKVSCGFPVGHNPLKAIGQCMDCECSGSGHFEIFISPALDDPARILDVLTHEMAHACLPFKTGHKKPFAILVRQLGLEGDPKATVASEQFTLDIAPMLAALGPYPHAKVTLKLREKKQTTRMLKAVCPASGLDVGEPGEICGYTCRLTQKWVDKGGAPFCPIHDTQMQLETSE